MPERFSGTLEWFGATTFRLCTRGLIIFLDTWLEKPVSQAKCLPIAEVHEADYIFISHAHFDHLPGADRIAKQTGAIVYANCEAINLLRKAGVPDSQLIAVQGGERLPLFTKQVRDLASKGEIPLRPGPPGAPAHPHPDHAVFSVDVWPALHCLVPSHDQIPDVMDTGVVYSGPAHPYVCTFDVNFGMKHGLLKLDELVPESHQDVGMKAFLSYTRNREAHVFSDHDGGQLMFNFYIVEGEKGLLWSAHLGGYEGILRMLEPKPHIAILGIAGIANHNGRPFDGSAADYVSNQIRWLAEPTKVIWCLHDESCIAPYHVDTHAATQRVEQETSSEVTEMNILEVLRFEF
ncbi:hypothetical protein NLU13_9781 [Sarocladium strictum]|uniref:Metallo-beta-lactamase domain-containing protein n=1 Tax=Sarocladium strictum TaxID=5046 RepID=A0AA39L3J3_SARSR|nr:hypothetical protein NLU13_9781 [Sarocladium strictum]